MNTSLKETSELPRESTLAECSQCAKDGSGQVPSTAESSPIVEKAQLKTDSECRPHSTEAAAAAARGTDPVSSPCG